MTETTISRPFAGAEYTFDLTFSLALEFERNLRKSLYAAMRAMLAGDWRLRDVEEIIRLGLIGGGTDDIEAVRLIEDHVKPAPIARHAKLCTDILEAAFFGQTAAKEEADRVFGTDGYGNDVR